MHNIKTTTEQPLVTFALFAYNQQKYIRKAVESALLQTYTPMQIILSDDCSSDNTFELMVEIANEYSGPNTILLNRNHINLGITAHVNKVLQITTGAFCIFAGGDDISIKERSEILVNKWLELNKQDCSIFTNAVVITDNDEKLGNYYNKPEYSSNIDHFIKNNKCWVGGFSHGFSMELYRNYGPITPETFQEDGAISFRALLNAGIHYIDLPTVFYRRHCNNAYDINDLKKYISLQKSELGLARGRLLDLKKDVRVTTKKRKAIIKILKKTIFIKQLLIGIPGTIQIIFFLKKLKHIIK